MGSNELFRQRDYLIVFVVIATSCVLLFDRPSLEFSLVPAWYIDQRAGKTNPVSTLDLRLVPPILTDLDGDGSKEFVVITKDLQLKVTHSVEKPSPCTLFVTYQILCSSS